jgi:hypothetical protein
VRNQIAVTDNGRSDDVQRSDLGVELPRYGRYVRRSGGAPFREVHREEDSP